jgi:ATP phosphoribosyltransferase regulatory subunit
MALDQAILRSGEQTIYRLRGLYEKYGYSRFKMSKFEEYDLYVRNKDFLVSDRMITFTDARGVLMALKPDVTLSIIKNTREDAPGPRKVYYNESVYRTGKSDGAFQEIMQTGLECIGDVDLYHIYEVIALAVQSLASISPDYVLDVSHMGLVSGFMEAAGVAEEDYPAVLAAAREKNATALRAFCQDRGLSDTVRALLEKLVTTYGSMETVLEELAPLCVGGKKTREAWEELSQLCALLKANGLGEKVYLDFSVEGDMDYYSGIVFRGFVKGLSAGVLSGGQYDKMVEKMGKRCGAIGFAIYLDELERLDPAQDKYDADVLVLYDEATDLGLLTEQTAALASQGKRALARRSPKTCLRVKETLDLRGKGGAKA